MSYLVRLFARATNRFGAPIAVRCSDANKRTAFLYTVKACAALSFLLVSAISATAQTYDAVADFSAVLNPNGVWGYGFTLTLGGLFVEYDPATSSFPGLDGWSVGGRSVPFIRPYILRNNTASPITFDSFILPPDLLNLHPGDGQLEYTLVRWRAPVAGQYRVQGRFTALALDNTSSAVQILLNGIAGLPGGSVNGSFNMSQTISYDFLQTVAAGDRIDFTVGNGGNGSSNDSTGFSATITNVTVVPEAGTLALLGFALVPVGIGLVRRRK